MNTLTTRIKGANNFVSLQPTNISDVLEAEKNLGLAFAKDFKEYLLTFGIASFDGKELTGICNSDRLNVVSLTERVREIYPLFPKDAYVIENLGFDHVFVIQDASGKVYSYGPNDSGEEIAGSLQDYLFPDNKLGR